MVWMNLFGDAARGCRKPSGFQSVATKCPGKSTLSRRDAETASICCVKALNRAGSPLYALFLAPHRRLLRHCDLFCEGLT